MPNRYKRDQLIKIALDMAQIPNLNVHDIPNGVVKPDAFSIQWLQDIIDFWYHMTPFSSTIATSVLNATATVDTIALPSDFILDVRNGYFVEGVPGDNQTLRKVYRLPLQKFLKFKLHYQKTTGVNFPLFYTILGTNIRITPTPDINTIGQIWYYQLPPLLETDSVPLFPNDYVCIEYIRIRALEWARIYDPGTAQKFCDKIVGGMRQAGLMNEPEDDEINLDEIVHRQGRDLQSAFSWMGTV